MLEIGYYSPEQYIPVFVAIAIACIVILLYFSKKLKAKQQTISCFCPLLLPLLSIYGMPKKPNANFAVKRANKNKPPIIKLAMRVRSIVDFIFPSPVISLTITLTLVLLIKTNKIPQNPPNIENATIKSRNGFKISQYVERT